MDLVGPLPVSKEGYKYLFTMTDRSTRWLEALPVKDLEAATAADALVSQDLECRRTLLQTGVP